MNKLVLINCLKSKVGQFEHPSGVYKAVGGLEVSVVSQGREGGGVVEKDEAADGVHHQGGGEHGVQADVGVVQDVPVVNIEIHGRRFL